jgi:TRAP-type C4-dicarboxylate transport system permease small subunit
VTRSGRRAPGAIGRSKTKRTAPPVCRSGRPDRTAAGARRRPISEFAHRLRRADAGETLSSISTATRSAPMLDPLRRLLDLLLAGIAALLLVALLVVVSLGVFTRGMNVPLAWTDEISRFIMIWLAVFGWVIGTRKRAHVRIRFFHDHMPAPIRRWLDFVIELAMVGFGLVVGWQGLALTIKNADLEATTIEISMGWMYAPLVVAGLITTAQALVEAFEHLTRPAEEIVP